MNRRNNKYTQEFKDSTVQLVVNSNKSVQQIARDLDVNPNTVNNWVKVYKRSNNIPKKSYASQSNTKENLSDELKRLRAENKILKQERDILKKATAYFAREVL